MNNMCIEPKTSATESSEIPEFFRQEIVDYKSPIGQLCLRTIFNLIPTEQLRQQVNFWPHQPSEMWQEPLKNVLLNSFPVLKKRIYIDESMLNNAMLRDLTHLAYQSIYKLASRLSLDSLPLFASKAPFNASKVIRENIERNPRLNTKKFVIQLAALIPLLNGSLGLTKKELAYQVDFLKLMCHSQSDNFLYQPNGISALMILVLQMAEDMTIETQRQVLIDCCSPDAISTLNSVANEGIGCLDVDGGALCQFIIHLEKLFLPLGKNVFPIFLKNFSYAVKYLKNDTHPSPRLACLKLHYFRKCGDMVYGFSPCLGNFLNHHEIYQTLDNLPSLTPYSEALSILIQKYFPEYPDSRIPEKIYKSWWYGQSLRGKSVALTERAIDWLMHECLVTQGNWELECEDAVQLVEDRFREAMPQFPFNTQRAEATHYLLQHQHRELARDSKKS